jgi:adenylate cyclase
MRVEKTRYEIPYGAHLIELDVYSGALEGLVVAEVEFGSEEESARFDPPDWFGSEVTDDVRYSNRSLAVHGRPEE